MSLAINPKIDGTLELKNNDTAKTLMTFDSQGRQTTPNGLSYVGGSTLVDGLSAVFTNSTNNINATGIGVGVEVGDVIQISGSLDNDTEFTVEVITDANNVIVNQAHAGGTTSKALVDETATVTVKLLCKWYLAPVGLGQGWVAVMSSRTINTPYQGQENRSTDVLLRAETTSDIGSIKVNGNTVAVLTTTTGIFSHTLAISGEETYGVYSGSGVAVIQLIWERR